MGRDVWHAKKLKVAILESLWKLACGGLTAAASALQCALPFPPMAARFGPLRLPHTRGRHAATPSVFEQHALTAEQTTWIQDRVDAARQQADAAVHRVLALEPRVDMCERELAGWERPRAQRGPRPLLGISPRPL